jgi:hypothetical protein
MTSEVRTPAQRTAPRSISARVARPDEDAFEGAPVLGQRELIVRPDGGPEPGAGLLASEPEDGAPAGDDVALVLAEAGVHVAEQLEAVIDAHLQ